MKSALNNTKTYNMGGASPGAIRWLSFSRRFLVNVVTVVTIIVFFVNADDVVMAQVLIVVGILFPCIVDLPPAIPDFSVEKRVSPRGRRGGHIAVPVLTQTGLQHQQIKGIFARVGQEPCPDSLLFIEKDDLGVREGIHRSPA